MTNFSNILVYYKAVPSFLLVKEFVYGAKFDRIRQYTKFGIFSKFNLIQEISQANPSNAKFRNRSVTSFYFAYSSCSMLGKLDKLLKINNITGSCYDHFNCSFPKFVHLFKIGSGAVVILPPPLKIREELKGMSRYPF